MQIAIYSRKSKWTGRGESVENQVIMCREYIEKFIDESQDAEITVYEDEGFSGKDTKRPQFQRMMADMKKSHYDYLVCYRLDRLGRNIADLALLIEELNKRETNFISIKEKFDTSTPIGKAMLYFSGVLAQMEREQIAERVCDNMAMLARDGRWLGGNTPLGFESREEKKITIEGKSKKSYCLTPKEEEIRLVRFMFQEYSEKQSLTKVVEYLLNHNITSRKNKEYTLTTVRDILTNPVYCIADKESLDFFLSLGCQVCLDREETLGNRGLMGYAKTSSSKYKNKDNPKDKWIIAVGMHEGIISGKEFVRVQRLLESNRQKGESFRRVQNEVALLSGLLYCSCGHAMRPKYYSAGQLTEEGERKFSYLCPYKDNTHREKCQVRNIPGNLLDRLVCTEVNRYTENTNDICQMLRRVGERIDGSRTEHITQVALMQTELRGKREEINNLISALAKSSASTEFVNEIEVNIKKLNIDCIKLEEDIKHQKKENLCTDRRGAGLELLMEQLQSFSRLFDTLTVPEKREYMRIMIERVVWDGENIQIFFCGGK